MNNILKSYAAIISVCIFWGFSFISTKLCLQWFSPFALAFYRFFIASIILLIAVLVKEKSLKIDKCDIFKFVIMGFTGVFLYFTFENTALKMLSASLASLILAALPAFALIADFIVFKKKFTKAKTLSVIISMLGVGLVVGFNSNENSSSLVLGIILLVLSLISWIIFSYISMPLQNKYSSLKATFYQTIFGALFFLIALPFSFSNLDGFNAIGIINLLFLGIICSAICYLLYNYAIKHLNIVVSCIFINLMPIITVIASIIILDESINLVQILGSILIIGSVFIVSKENN